MNASELRAANLRGFLRTASLLELEGILRGVAVELQERSVPATRKLFDFARELERHRAMLRAAASCS